MPVEGANSPLAESRSDYRSRSRFVIRPTDILQPNWVMPQFFEKRDRWGQGLGLWVLVGMAFVLPFAVWGVFRLRMDHSLEQWLAQDQLQIRQSAWQHQHFGPNEPVLVSWEGSAIEDPRVEQLARKLLGTTDADGIRRGGLQQVAAVQTPGQLLQQMTAAKVDRSAAIQRLTGILAGAGPIWCQLTTAGLNQKTRSLRVLKDQAAKRFGIELQIRERFGAAAEQAAVEADAETEPVEAAEGAAATVTAIATTEPEPPVEEIAVHDFQVSWERMHANPKVINDFIAWAKELKIPVAGQLEGEPLLSLCFVHSGQPAAIAVSLSESGWADLSGTLELIRESAQGAGIPRDSLQLAGSPVLTVQLNDEISRIAWNPAAPWYLPLERSILLCCGVVGVILSCWLLGNIRLGLIVAAAAGFTTLATFGVVCTLSGPLNTALLVIPLLVLITTTSFALVIVETWKREAIRDSRSAIINTVLSVRMPGMLALCGSAVALAALLTSPLIPVRLFGVNSIAGLVVCALTVLYGIPAMLQAWPLPAPAAAGTGRGFWTFWGRLTVRYSTFIAAAAVMVSAATIYGLTKSQIEVRAVAGLQQSSRLVQDTNKYEQNLAGTLPLETVISFGKEAREELGITQRIEIVRTIEQKLRQLPGINGTLSLADFQPIHEPLSEEATLREKQAFRNRAKAVEASIRQDAYAAAMYQIAKTTDEFTDAGEELWRISGTVAVTSRLEYQSLIEQVDSACRSVIKYHADTRHVVTGPIPMLHATQLALSDTLFYASLLACGGMAIVMLFATRDLWAGLLAMIPHVLPVAAVLGFAVWRGMLIDVNTLLIAAVGLGISLTRTVYLLSRYRAGLIAGISRRRAIVKMLEQCGAGLTQSSIIASSLMLVLSLSPMLLLSRLGTLTSSMVMASLISSMLLTPAMLAGPLGWLIFFSVQKQRNRLKAVTEDPELEEIDRHGPHIMPPKPQIAASLQTDSSRQFDTRESRHRKRRR